MHRLPMSKAEFRKVLSYGMIDVAVSVVSLTLYPRRSADGRSRKYPKWYDLGVIEGDGQRNWIRATEEND